MEKSVFRNRKGSDSPATNAFFSVIIHLDVLKDFTLGLVSCFKPVPVNFLNFQRVHKTLSDRVVPTVAFAAHARDDLMPFKQRLIITAGILAASVRVMDKPCRRIPSTQSLL